jgi:hypothetical protein
MSYYTTSPWHENYVFLKGKYIKDKHTQASKYLQIEGKIHLFKSKYLYIGDLH